MFNELKKSLESAKKLRKVISTMEMLSNSRYKKYQNYTDELFSYRKNIELSLQILFNNSSNINIKNSNKITNLNTLSIVFGSNQGLCGRFNDKIIDFISNNISSINENHKIIVIGNKIHSLLKSKNFNIVKNISFKNSDDFLNVSNDVILSIINQLNWANEIFLFYTIDDKSSNGSVVKTKLFPIDSKMIEKLKIKHFSTNKIPFWRIEDKKLFLELFKEYIYINIQIAFINSITIEQKNRFMILKDAKKNIDDTIELKTQEYNRIRQNTITNDLINNNTAYFISKKNNNF